MKGEIKREMGTSLLVIDEPGIGGIHNGVCNKRGDITSPT